jgi:hypothetical protein
MGIEHWWYDSHRREQKNSEKETSQCYHVHHNSHMDWRGIEIGAPRTAQTNRANNGLDGSDLQSVYVHSLSSN